MGLLEDLLSRAQPGTFPPIADVPIDPVEEATAAQAARDAAAERMRRGVKRPIAPMAEGPPLSFGSLVAGMPTALGAGMAPPTPSPDTPVEQTATPAISGPVPLPQDRPKEADGAPVAPTDMSSANQPPGPPLNILPPAQIQPDNVPPRAPAAPDATVAPAGPSIFGRLMSGLHDNSATLLALGAGMAGAPNIGQGISRAAAAAIPASQADQKNRLVLQNQTQTFNALLAAKVPPNMAMAALTNPEIMKAVSAKYLETKPLQHVVLKDSLGNETAAVFDQNKGVYLDANGKPLNSGDQPAIGSAAAAKLTPNYDPVTKRDDAFLAALDPVTASAVKDIADGKLPGTGRNLQKLMPLVSRYENGFDNTTYQARQNLQKSYYGGGEGAKALRSANTTIDHGIQLQKAIEDLHNYSVLPGFINPVTGAVSKQFDKKYQDALARFKTNSELYSKELDVALTGKSTVSGANHIRDMFDVNGSPVANKAALQQTLEMLDQRVSEHENTYRTGMNQHGAVFNDMLTQRDKLKKLLGQDTGAGTHAPAAPAPGNYTYDPATKKMVPAQ